MASMLKLKLGLRSRLLLTLLMAFLALAGIMVWQSMNERDGHIQAALERLLDQARLGAAHQQTLIDRANALLDSLIQSAEMNGASGEACSSELEHHLKSAPDFLQLAKAGPDGNLLCAAVGGSKANVHWEDRPWFQQALRSQGLVVSEVPIGRILGLPVITLSKAQRDAAGNVEAVYFLSLGVDWLKQLLVRGSLPEDFRLAVFNSSGTVVLRHPDPEGLTGTRLADPMLSQVVANSGEGMIAATGLDKKERLIAYTPLLSSASSHAYYLLLTESRQQVEAPLMRQLMLQLLLALAVLLGTLALVFWGANRYAINPLRSLSRNAQRFGTGDLTIDDKPHTSGEIGELAGALDAMAVALADSTVSRQRLQEEIDQRTRTESRLQMTLKGASAGIFDWNIETGEIMGSDEVWALNGLPPTGKPVRYEDWRQGVHPDDVQGLERNIAFAMAQRAEIESEWRVNLSPGTAPRWLMSRTQPLPEPDGRLLRYAGIVMDVTKRRVAEQQMRDSETLFRTIFDHNLDAVMLTIADGTLLAANGEAQRLFGHTEDELRALGRQGVADATDPRLAPALAQRAAQGWFRGEITMIAKDGRKFPAEISSSSFIGKDGVHMSSMLVRDITERQREAQRLQEAKHEAERANNAKSRFLAAASHDLRQPLTALGMYTGLLQHTASASERKVVANMQACIDSLSELLNDLLDLSKLEAGVVTPTLSDFPIADVFASLASVHAPEARAKGLRLRFVPSALTARTDLVLLRRCLGNLVENALRYTERGGVLVACRRRQGRSWVKVWDTGIGIPQDKTVEIFEEFKQLGDGARNKGSGLGLAIVARTATLLGLAFTVRSWSGRGSVFAIELPLGQPALVLAPAAPAPQTTAPRLLRIALVDDNAIVRESLSDVLQCLGHEVLAVGTQAELLAGLDPFRPDLLVCDYRLTGGETGFDVITAVRARLGAEFPTILITGDTDPQLLRSMSGRSIIVLHKPLDLGTLQDCLKSVSVRAT